MCVFQSNELLFSFFGGVVKTFRHGVVDLPEGSATAPANQLVVSNFGDFSGVLDTIRLLLLAFIIIIIIIIPLLFIVLSFLSRFDVMPPLPSFEEWMRVSDARDETASQQSRNTTPSLGSRRRESISSVPDVPLTSRMSSFPLEARVSTPGIEQLRGEQTPSVGYIGSTH